MSTNTDLALRDPHPFAELFPPMSADEFHALKIDIATNGVHAAVWLFEKQILDGRHRAKACAELGLDYPAREYTGTDPVGFVISLNLRRRHLNESQKAFVAKDALAMFEREAKKRMSATLQQNATARALMPAPEKRRARDDAAQLVGVSPRYVQSAKAISEKAPDLEPAIRAGTMTITAAEREIKERDRESKREENRAIIRTVSAPDVRSAGARFSTIVIDPPWDWGDEGDQDQLGRARPDYATMSIENIRALPVGEMAADDCHIYLWITNRSLPKGFSLLEAWGFRYVTCLTWCKPSFGMGNYFRGSTEQLLFGVKGSQMLKRRDLGTWFPAPRPGGHSAKPGEAYALIESASPGPYLEMFSRSDREGWVHWGEHNAAA